MKIIFTGGAYWLVDDKDVPAKINGDFAIVNGRRWIKSTRSFGRRAKMFACPKGFQILTDAEAKAQGLQ